MGTDKVIFVGVQWGATGSHVTGTDVTGSHATGRKSRDRKSRDRKFFNRLYDLACSGAVYN